MNESCSKLNRKFGKKDQIIALNLNNLFASIVAYQVLVRPFVILYQIFMVVYSFYIVFHVLSWSFSPSWTFHGILCQNIQTIGLV